MRWLGLLAALLLVSSCVSPTRIDSDWLVGRWKLHAVEAGRDSTIVVHDGSTFTMDTNEKGTYSIHRLDDETRSMDIVASTKNSSYYQTWRFSSDHRFAQVKLFTKDVVLGEQYLGTLDAFRQD